MPWPGDLESVTVTWMDGKQETYPCNTFSDDDGVLRLSSRYRNTMVEQVSNEENIPLNNVRVYTPNRTT